MAGGPGATSTSSPDSPLNQNIDAPGSLGGDITDPSVPSWVNSLPQYQAQYQTGQPAAATPSDPWGSAPLGTAWNQSPMSYPTSPEVQQKVEQFGNTLQQARSAHDNGQWITGPDGQLSAGGYDPTSTLGTNGTTGGTPQTGGNTQPSKGATGGTPSMDGLSLHGHGPNDSPYDSVYSRPGDIPNDFPTMDSGSGYNPQPMPIGNSQPSKGATGTGGNTQPSKGATRGYI